ncbi:MAG: hypothetical protein K2L98_03290 [Bacilli bacterium]|nr:hypothetical protein [Bacilli bacterium]
MTEEELQELENSVEEARKHLIELNDKYNEILTKEHEAQFKKNNFSRKNMSMDEFSLALKELFDIDTTPKTEEEKEIETSNTQYTIRLVIIILLGLLFIPFSPLAILPAALLVVINAVYSGKKNNKIREKYKSKAKEAREEKKEPEKSEKDALYDELCEARQIYNTLRKEYESKKFNSELAEKEEDNNVVGAQGNSMDPQLYQIYSEYIDYVKNVTSMGVSRCANNKRKMYGINPEEL